MEAEARALGTLGATLFPWKFLERRNREHYFISTGISRNLRQGQGGACTSLQHHRCNPLPYLVISRYISLYLPYPPYPAISLRRYPEKDRPDQAFVTRLTARMPAWTLVMCVTAQATPRLPVRLLSWGGVTPSAVAAGTGAMQRADLAPYFRSNSGSHANNA